MYALAQLPSTTPLISYATAAAAPKHGMYTQAFPSTSQPNIQTTLKDFLKVPTDMVSRVSGGKRIDPIRITTGANIMFRKMMDKDNNVEEVAIISGSQQAVMHTSHLIRAAIIYFTNQTTSAQVSQLKP